MCLLPSRSRAGDTTADSVVSLPEHSHDSSDFSNRYPLFIQVNDKAETHNKSRVPPAKPVNRPAKQEAVQNKRPPQRNRSASFTPVRKASDSRPQCAGVSPKPSQTNQFSQEEARVGNLRREKSDIVKSRRIAPAATTGVSRPTRSHSSSNLKQGRSAVLSPRSRSPAGTKCESINNSKQRPTQESRRENSDILQPGGQGWTNSLTLSSEKLDSDLSRSSSNRSLTSNPSPGNSIQESQSLSNSSSEMSKIPSLSRSPASSDSHVSRIPSLTKQNGGEERTPPRSKIPSLAKNDKGQEHTVKKSQIPTGGRKDSASQKDKVGSKIPSSTGSPQNRSDSAKENEDPTRSGAGTAIQNGHEATKQGNKIPSVSKSVIPKSKIPSVTRKDSKNEEQAAINGSSGLQSPVSHIQGDAAKSRIPTSSSSPLGGGVGLTRTPASAKSLQPKQDTRSDNLMIGQSRIPTIPSTPVSKTPETKIPSPGGSKLPEPKVAAKSTPSSLPVAKTTGRPKPSSESTPSERLITGSRIPGYAGERETRKTSTTEKETAQSSVVVDVSTDDKSKIPSLSKTFAPKTHSTSPDGNEQTPPKPKFSIPTLGGRQLSFEEEVQGLSRNPPVTPPSTPTLTTPLDQTDTDIFSEAKKMEKLLRDAPMELEKEKEDEEFLRHEREIERLEDGTAQEGLGVLETKEAEDLISEVLKSYAPDINKDNQSALQNTTSKENNVDLNDTVHLNGGEDKLLDKNEEPHFIDEVKLSELAIDLSSPSIMDKVTEEKAEEKVEVPETAIKSQEMKLISVDATPPGDAKEIKNDFCEETQGSKSEGPPIDTLGEYAQQARRSRSRQRKVVSPDSDQEPGKEFGKAQEKDIKTEPDKEPTKNSRESSPKEQPNRDIKKDKFGTAPYESEKKSKESSKPAKLKSKNEKPKFVIESSLGKDFYASRKSDEIAVSKESIQGDNNSTSNRELPALVFEGQVTKQPFELKPKAAPNTAQAIALEEAKFEDVELNPEPKIKKDRREISGSIDDLDEKTVKCMCGRGGKCSIM